MKPRDIGLLVVVGIVVLAIIAIDANSGGDNTDLALLGIGMAFYFAPSFIALHRQHRQTAPIFALNLLLGWTFVGWVGAIVWALMAQNRNAI